MTPKTFFTPGPSALYFTVEDHMKQALKEQIPSISHRSKAFESIYAECVENLKQLLQVPAHVHIFFTGSATEIWERIIQNCVEKESYHLVNGAFSARFHETALELGRKAEKTAAPYGRCVKQEHIRIPETAELIAFTQNETSTGAAQPLEDIYATKRKYPEKLVAVDVVSTLPYINLNHDIIDTSFFSVQKGFGLPAGLGVWIVNEKCIEKAKSLQEKGYSIGSYHTLPALLDKGKKNQTPETPNILGIYLLAKVCGDMLRKGIDTIRKETDYKAAVLYHAINQHHAFTPFVSDSAYQSKTVIVANTQTDSLEFIQKLKEKNMHIGSGYGSYKNSQIRIANFPAHSKEQVEMLADEIAGL